MTPRDRRSTTRRRAPLAAAVCAGLLLAATAAIAAEHVPAARAGARTPLDVDVWISKDEGGVFHPGEPMRIYFRASADAYVLVYNIDTEGYIHLIYPFAPDDTPYVDGGRTQQIPSRRDPYDLVADGPPGIEYVVAVASPFPFRNLPWYLSRDRADAERPAADEEFEDETDEGAIAGDPYVAIDRINRRIVPPGRLESIATSETYFYVERRVDYPRYVCADCHYGRPYFDPFITTCSVVDIRIDATWARYAPIRPGTVRPRYFYRIRSEAPTRYRAWKEQWSSLDGRATLRSRFTPGGNVRLERDRAPLRRSVPPEFRDLRRRPRGRFWQGRDEILKLRERRLEESRSRGEVLEQEKKDRETGRARSRAEDRARIREKAEPPRRGDEPARNRPQARPREERRERSDARERERARVEANERERAREKAEAARKAEQRAPREEPRDGRGGRGEGQDEKAKERERGDRPKEPSQDRGRGR